MITVQIPQMAAFQKHLAQSPQITQEELKKAIKDSALVIQAKSIEEAPQKTRALQRSIKPFFDRLTQLEARIAPTVDYAVYVHEGTRAHTITPKNKPFLAFKKNGKWIYTRRVNHPGTKANPFMKRGLEQSRSKINSVFMKALERITNRLVTK